MGVSFPIVWNYDSNCLESDANLQLEIKYEITFNIVWNWLFLNCLWCFKLNHSWSFLKFWFKKIVMYEGNVYTICFFISVFDLNLVRLQIQDFLGKWICYKPLLKTFSNVRSVVQNDLKIPRIPLTGPYFMLCRDRSIYSFSGQLSHF